MSDNELIAEFMGFERIAPDKWITRYTTGLLDPYFGQFRAVHMRFETSWDWLMPVVKKTFDTEFGNNFTEWSKRNKKICDSLGLCDIDVVYHAVVDFIKWHNSQAK